MPNWWFNDEQPHDKGCTEEYDGARHWDSRCEDKDQPHGGLTNWSHNPSVECPASIYPAIGSTFQGHKVVATKVSPDGDPAWLAVYTEDPVCKLKYDEANSEDHGCVEDADGAKAWYTQCKVGNTGNWSLKCSDKLYPAIGSTFKGGKVKNVKKDPTSAHPDWIEVDVADPQCDLWYNEAGAQQPPPNLPYSIGYKNCRDQGRGWNVRCERKSDGTKWSWHCSDALLPKVGDLFKGKKVLSIKPRYVPNELYPNGDLAWAGVNIEDEECKTSYNEAKADTLSCGEDKTIQPWKVECQYPDGQWSWDCSSHPEILPQVGQKFKDQEVISATPNYNNDQAWAYVETKTDNCVGNWWDRYKWWVIGIIILVVIILIVVVVGIAQVKSKGR